MMEAAYLSLPLRDPTHAEMAALRKVLSFDFEGVEELRKELAGLHVRLSCACGCPSIALFHPEGHRAYSRHDGAGMTPMDFVITAGPDAADYGG